MNDDADIEGVRTKKWLGNPQKKKRKLNKRQYKINKSN